MLCLKSFVGCFVFPYADQLETCAHRTHPRTNAFNREKKEEKKAFRYGMQFLRYQMVKSLPWHALNLQFHINS